MSINTARYLSTEHWWDLITFESIFLSYTLIVCLCLKYLVFPSQWRTELGVWEIVDFHVAEETVCSFFNFFLDPFGIISKYYFRMESCFGMEHYLFASQRESQSVSDMIFFAILLNIYSHLELSRIELPKSTKLTKITSILMEIVTSYKCSDRSPLFSGEPAHKSLSFLKKLSLS